MDTHNKPNNTIKEKVFEIADNLSASGTLISTRLILSMMSEVSSTSTIHKYLKEWREQQDAKTQETLQQTAFSSDFKQAFRKEMNRFNGQVEAKHKQAAVEACESRDVILESLEKAEQAIETYRRKALKLEEDLSEQGKELETEKKRHDAIISELRNQIKEKSEANDSLLNQNESLRTGITKAEVVAENKDVIISEIKEGHAKSEADKVKLSEEVSELRENNSKLRESEAISREKLSGKEKLIEELKNRVQQDIESRAELGNSNKELQSKVDIAVTQRDALQSQLSELSAKFEAANAQVLRLSDRVAEQSTVIETLNKADKNKKGEEK